MRRRAVAVTAVTAVTGSLVTGCLPHQRPQGAPPAKTVTRTPTPGPTITVIRSGPTLDAGGSTDFTAQAGVSLRLTASRAQVSRTRLSASYGYPPARGYYVTFTITIVNTGNQPVDLGPSSFHVRISGEGTVTSYDGNAPYSGASQQLDNTEVAPGERLQAPLTFDVRRPHGRLEFLPDGSAAVIWRF